MNKFAKRFFAIVLGGLLCLHFAMVFIYCTPLKLNTPKLNFISQLYIYPVFHQNWSLFVPAPNAHRKLFVRYKTDNKRFSDWKDILDEEIISHKKNRFLGRETKVLLLSNSLIYELNYLDGKSSFVYIVTPKNKEFEVLKFEVNQYLKNNFTINKNTIYELLLVSTQKNKSTAYHFKKLILN